MVLKDVPDQIRTSWNAWCQHPGCYNHPIHERVITRIMDIVGLPHDHAEHMQLLKYGPGNALPSTANVTQPAGRGGGARVHVARGSHRCSALVAL